MMSPLPTISKAYGLLLQEEQQKEVNSNRNHNLESTVFTARKFTDSRPYKSTYASNSGNFGAQNTSSGSQQRNFTYFRNNLYCEHCKMKNHTIDRCWKLHGYPKDFKNKGKRVAAAASLDDYSLKETQTEREPGVVHATFTEEQYSQLMQYLNNNQVANQPENSGSHSLGLAATSQHKGIFCLSANFKRNWILDSGASDHMCSNLSLFDSFETVSKDQHTITIPDGTELQVKHKGIVHLGPNIILKDVLHVPEFQFNLISVSKLCCDAGCSVSFTNNDCVLQDLSKSKHILLGRLHKGLYRFNEDLMISDTQFSHNNYGLSTIGSAAV